MKFTSFFGLALIAFQGAAASPVTPDSVAADGVEAGGEHSNLERAAMIRYHGVSVQV
jgi:hypothetical protein